MGDVMDLTRIFHIEVLGFLYALAAIITWQALTGRISLNGLLSDKGGQGQTSPGRIQLLLATMFACASYLGDVAKVTDGNLPPVSQNMLYIFGGSSGIYALEKAWAMWNNNKKGTGGK